MLVPNPLYNHLSYTLSTECFASNKVLIFEGGNSVAQRCEQHNYTGCYEAACRVDHAQNLEDAHPSIQSGPHVISCDFANDSIEFRRSRADSKQ